MILSYRNQRAFLIAQNEYLNHIKLSTPIDSWKTHIISSTPIES